MASIGHPVECVVQGQVVRILIVSDRFGAMSRVGVWCGGNVVVEVSAPRHVVVCYVWFNPYPTAFPYGNGMVLHFYQQQESSTTKTVHKVINKGLKTYV